MIETKLPITNDYIFKKIFVKRGNATKLEQWMQFLSQTNQREVELAMKENKEIKKANEEYEYLTGDEAERRLAFLRDKAIRDENNMIASAKEEGMKQEKIEIAKKLLSENMSIEQIIRITNLTKDEIEKLDTD